MKIKRILLSVLGLAASTYLCKSGSLSGEAFVYALVIIVTGHHSVELIKAWRGVGETPGPSSASTEIPK